METKEVFISYKAEEVNEAYWVRSILESHGIGCWMAPDDIPVGSDYVRASVKAIEKCKVFLVILSQRAQTSVWISKELDVAIGAGKTIMPYLIEDCSYEAAFRLYLSNVPGYEAYQDKQNTILKMVSDIKQYLNADETEEDDAIFTKSFKRKVKFLFSNAKDAVVSCIKRFALRFTPYSQMVERREFLSMHILSAILLIVFVFLFFALAAETEQPILSFVVAFLTSSFGWGISGLVAKLCGKAPNSILTVLLSLIAGFLLLVVTMYIGYIISTAFSFIF